MKHSYGRRSVGRVSALAAILAPLALAACAEVTTNICCTAEAREDFQFTRDATGRSRFRVEGVNGRVLVILSTGENFIVRGQKRAGGTSEEDAAATLLNLSVQITESGDSIVVESVHPRADGRPYVVDYTLEVPARLVGEIATVNGDVEVEGLENGVTIQILNGSATLTDIQGSTETDVANGDTTAEISIVNDEVIDLAVLNGAISLSIPSGTNAELEARTDNGEVTVTGLTLTNELITSNVVTGTIGTGTGSIMLNVDNGDITLRGF